jgi:hypothetical protein
MHFKVLFFFKNYVSFNYYYLLQKKIIPNNSKTLYSLKSNSNSYFYNFNSILIHQINFFQKPPSTKKASLNFPFIFDLPHNFLK